MIDSTTTIISSSYKIQRDVQLSAGGNPPFHRFCFAVARIRIFNQSDTRVNPITIYSLNSLIKSGLWSFFFCFLHYFTFFNDYHLLLCYNSKFLPDTLVVPSFDKNSPCKFQRSCCRWYTVSAHKFCSSERESNNKELFLSNIPLERRIYKK